jgi:L-threonylcarbamoyladenylate synthase
MAATANQKLRMSSFAAALASRPGGRISSAMTTFASAQVAEAAAALRRGEIVAFPTETYYGLAVDALDEVALDRLFRLKGRDGEKASALLVADLATFAGLCAEVPPRADELAHAHWPGPLTLALPARPGLPAAIVHDGFVAARVSSHPVAQALVVAAGRPITATSANPAGAAPVRSVAEVRAYFGEQALHLLDGGETSGGPPSTLVRLRGDQLEILRRGAISI